MRAYYNEIDPYAAQWLQNLIAAGHIAPGDVDERSIAEVRADDLRDYTQCHFFAGIGGWSLALRLAGWPDDRSVWTGSCPCQPFSTAGKGAAADDERHLWPAWFPLIAECRPPVLFGEQVEAAIGWGWLDAVFADLEGEGYACGAAVLPACGVGAPHIRQRLWFVAHALRSAGERRARGFPRAEASLSGARLVDGHLANGSWDGSKTSFVAIADGRNASTEGLQPSGEQRLVAEDGRSVQLADAALGGRREKRQDGGRLTAGDRAQGIAPGFEPGSDTRELGHATSDGQRQLRPSEARSGRPREARRSSPWDDLEWLQCIDGKARPTQPGIFPLAHGIPRRVGRLRAYGNAIVPQVAAEFIIAVSGLRP